MEELKPAEPCTDVGDDDPQHIENHIVAFILITLALIALTLFFLVS